MTLQPSNLPSVDQNTCHSDEPTPHNHTLSQVSTSVARTVVSSEETEPLIPITSKRPTNPVAKLQEFTRAEARQARENHVSRRRIIPVHRTPQEHPRELRDLLLQPARNRELQHQHQHQGPLSPRVLLVDREGSRYMGSRRISWGRWPQMWRVRDDRRRTRVVAASAGGTYSLSSSAGLEWVWGSVLRSRGV